MKTPTPVSHSDLGPQEMHCDYISHSGVEMSTVNVLFDDGTVRQMYICNKYPGYFSRVFVPWDFESEKIVPDFR